MSRYTYRSLTSHMAVTVRGVAVEQSRHFRTALGGDHRELLAGVRAATKAVLEGGSDLVAGGLDDLPAMIRGWILAESRTRGRLDVQLELEIARRFTLRTDIMAKRCLDLSRLALKVAPGPRARRFLGRVGRSYILGLNPEAIVMCRAALEQAVVERFERARKPLPPVTEKEKSAMRVRLRRAEELKWITTRQREDAWKVWLRGNKAIHNDPHLTTDAKGTIAMTMAILDALHSDQPAA